MTRWAVFDIDGTLFPGGSLERRFLRRMLAEGMLPPQNIARFLYRAAGESHRPADPFVPGQ